jgi:beta-glucosidase-like glycosyl hydrolase
LALAAVVSALAALLAQEATIERLGAWVSTPTARPVSADGSRAEPAILEAGIASDALGPREKAALVVISGLPAPPGVGGVIVRRWDRHLRRPRRALVFADQEGGPVRAFPELAPRLPPSSYRSTAEAFAAGKETGTALAAAGVDVDLAPVLDAPDGPLGSRHFRSQRLGVAFGLGLERGGTAACAKHFPGLGSAAESTDEARVLGRLRSREIRGFRVTAFPCVMVGHAIYPRLGSRRASLEPATYRSLRRHGFRGVAITDSLGILGSPYAPYWARLALRAGADMVLFTSARDARRAIRALVPLARRGELDDAVRRVLRFRARYLDQ